MANNSNEAKRQPKGIDMDNVFRPGKWLVLFCGVFVLLWGALQFVSNSRLKQEAEVVGQHLFTWTNQGDRMESFASITDATILEKSDRDAVVQIKGQQTLAFYPPDTKAMPGTLNSQAATPGAAKADVQSKEGADGILKPEHIEKMDCEAKLTFYRMSEQKKDFWVLGKVEFPN